MNGLTGNSALAKTLTVQIFNEPALVPPTPSSKFFDGRSPAKPALTADNKVIGDTVTVSWKSPTNQSVRWWILQKQTGTNWTTEYLAAKETSRTFSGTLPEAIAISAMYRGDVLSQPAVVMRKK
jgi:hypothetical protein